MKRTIRLRESELRRMITESVRRVLRESTRPRKRINEVSAGLIKRASDAAYDKGKKQQWIRFDNALSEKIIDALANDTSYWIDEFEYGDREFFNLPPNFDRLSDREKAEIVYNQSQRSDEQWMEIFGLDDDYEN